MWHGCILLLLNWLNWLSWLSKLSRSSWLDWLEWLEWLGLFILPPAGLLPLAVFLWWSCCVGQASLRCDSRVLPIVKLCCSVCRCFLLRNNRYPSVVRQRLRLRLSCLINSCFLLRGERFSP